MGSVAAANAADVVLADFSGGVAQANHPEGAGQFGIWYDTTNGTFGTPSASTLNGSAAMKIDDGGFANGVYIIYSAAIPATGTYSVAADIQVVESGSVTAIGAYQLGVAVGANAQHRGLNPSNLAGLSTAASVTGLTAGNDSANPVQTVETASFTANAGDNVLIAFATDVQTGNWTANSATWSGSHVLVDNIVLKDLTAPPPPPPTNTDPIVVDNFSGGVAQANNPTPGAFKVWYDANSSTFGTPVASTLDGSQAMRVDDGGFANGIYAIYDGVITETGTYQLEIDMDVVETAAGVNGIRAYQVGVATGATAVHRTGASVPSLAITGTYLGLTPASDNANPTQKVITGLFTANAGDNLLIALGTDVVSGTWAQNSSTWGGSHMLVDNIVLRPVIVEPPPFEVVLDNDSGAPTYTTTGSWTTSGTPGYNGTTYQFATAGQPNTSATWTGEVPEDGFYTVSVQYRAGTNRATQTKYNVTTVNGVESSIIDQQLNSLSWVELGEYELAAGSVSITLDASGTVPAGAVVIADAVRIAESAGPPPIVDPELRVAIVLVFDEINSTQAIQNLVDQIAKDRYNAISIHARYRGDATYFPNKVDATFPNNEPRHPAAGSIDVLEEFIVRGHAKGLKVFAYVNTHLVTDGSDTDPRPNHIVNTHPDWRTWAWNNGNPIPQTTAEEFDGVWIEPALPEVQVYLANIAGDILMNYDVDGIVIDRIRYPDTTFGRTKDYGFHPYAIEEFNRLYNKSGIPDPNDVDWQQYRRDNITRTVQMLYSTINSVKPEALLLAYPVGRFDDAINFNYQDWPTWINREIIDVLMPQIYTPSNATFAARASQAVASYSGERLMGVTIDVFRTGQDIVAQLDIARQLGLDGSSPYYHTQIGPRGYEAALDEAYFGIAPFPATPWNTEEVECPGLDLIGGPNGEVLLGSLCDELIVGGGGNDTILASAGDDYLVPDPGTADLAGNDVVDGGDGVDTVDYSGATAPVTIDLTTGTASGASIGSDNLSGLEIIKVNVAAGNNVFVGDAGDNVLLSTGSGSSVLGAVLTGGDGNDTLNAGGAAFYAAEGATLDGGAGNDTLEATAGPDTLTGGDGDDTLLAHDGRDTLVGGAGNDIIDGGDGQQHDTVIYALEVENYSICANADGSYTVTALAGTEGTDTVRNIGRWQFGKHKRFTDWLVKKGHITTCP